MFVGGQDDGKIEVIDSTAGELRLIVRDLVPSDSARYTCSAASDEDLGSHEMTASVTVRCKLSFQSVTAFASLILACWMLHYVRIHLPHSSGP